jgi:hypothetical protein
MLALPRYRRLLSGDHDEEKSGKMRTLCKPS